MKADLEIKQKKIQTKHAGLEESCRTQVWSSRQFWFNWLKSPKEIQLKLGIFGFWNGFWEEQKIDYSNRRPFWKNHAALKICFLLKKLTSPLPFWCFWRWWFSKKLAIWWDRLVPPGSREAWFHQWPSGRVPKGHLSQPEWHMTSFPNAVGVAPHAWNHHLSQLGKPLSLLASWSILPKNISVWPPKDTRFLTKKKNASGRHSENQKTLTGISKAGVFRRNYFWIASLQVDEKWLPIFDDGKFTTIPGFTENLFSSWAICVVFPPTNGKALK